MARDKLFNALDTQAGDSSKKRRLLAVHLREQLKLYKQHPERGMDIAYHIAGLLATSFARSLSRDDPYEVILWMAGQLELPEAHRDEGASWGNMERLIYQLPD